ncbi:MAG: class I SAM-dependent methyltransferase [Vicinamibacterales bacterium]
MLLLLRHAARSSLDVLGQALKVASACAFHAAGGLRPLGEVRQDIEQHWGAFAEERDWTGFGLWNWEHLFYSAMLNPKDRVLVVGCGTGRDLIALLEQGYRVEGVELVNACVEQARAALAARNLTATVRVGSIESVELPGAFDVFIFSWFCYSYIPQAASRIRVLRRLKSLLNPGGRILISYVPRTKPASPLPVRVARLAARLGRSGWRPEPGDVIKPSKNGASSFSEHRFSPGEIENEARAAGLVVRFDSQSDNVGTATLV